MRKRIFGRRLKRDKNARKALFRGLMRSFFLHGRIQTTEAKAKAIRGRLEKLVTKAKRRGVASRNELLKNFDRDIVEKLINDIAPRFENRPGGYTRFVRAGGRVKDNASMVIFEWADENIKNEISNIKYEDKEKKERKSNKISSQLEESGEVAKVKTVKTKTKRVNKNAKDTGKSRRVPR